MRVPPLLACRPCPYDPLQSTAPFGRFKHAASGHTFQMLSLLLGQLRDIHPEAFPFGASRLGLSVRIIPNIALRQTGVGAHFQQMSRRTPVFGYSLGNAASIEGKMPRRAISPCRAASCSGVISRGMPWRWMSTSASNEPRSTVEPQSAERARSYSERYPLNVLGVKTTEDLALTRQ